jgi:hypothetical protein
MQGYTYKDIHGCTGMDGARRHGTGDWVIYIIYVRSLLARKACSEGRKGGEDKIEDKIDLII